MPKNKVEFFLNEIEDEKVRKQFDEFRQWHDDRESHGTPFSQTFEGVLSPDESARLYIPGTVYGYSGMSETFGGFWAPMLTAYNTAGGELVFLYEADNTENNYVRIKADSFDTKELGYTATVFYRGNDGER